MIPLSSIKPNPNNPRVIKDAAFEKLCRSIQEFPKMMRLRPIVVDNDMMVLGGNMRLRALQHLGYKSIPDDWLRKADELTTDEQRSFIIADNVQGGEWDYEVLHADWSAEELEAWGVEVDFPDSDEDAVEDNVWCFAKAGHRRTNVELTTKDN
jgi:ParB-like chromosome segregation protein Spo0J